MGLTMMERSRGGERWSGGKTGSGSEIKIWKRPLVGVKCLITAGLWLSGEDSVRPATKMELKLVFVQIHHHCFNAPSVFSAFSLRAHLCA